MYLNRLLSIVLLVLIVLAQYAVWWGNGGWTVVRGKQAELDVQRAYLQKRSADKVQIVADVQDLSEGLVAVEERARSTLGMVKQGEIFVQVGVGGAGAK